jgi:hypothetical protein
MFNDNAIDTCTCDKLTITNSDFRSGNLRMLFTKFESGYSFGDWITVTCTGMRNPIYPDVWRNFDLKIYDYSKIGTNINANIIQLT